MALIQYDHNTIMAAIKPGLAAYIVGRLKTSLEEKMNNAIADVYNELVEQLPSEIDAKIKSILAPEYDNVKVDVVINLGEDK